MTSTSTGGKNRVIRMNLDDVLSSSSTTSSSNSSISITNKEIDDILSKINKSKKNKTLSSNNPQSAIRSKSTTPNEIIISADELTAINDKKNADKRARSAPPVSEDSLKKMDAFDKLDSIFINNAPPPSYQTAITTPPQQTHNVNNTITNIPAAPNTTEINDLQERIKKVRDQIQKINAKIQKKGRNNVSKKYLDALEQYEKKERKYGKMLENATLPTITPKTPTNVPNPSPRPNNKLDILGDLDAEIAAATTKLNADLAQPPRPSSRLSTPPKYTPDTPLKSILKPFTTSPMIVENKGRMSAADLDKKKEQQASIYSMSSAINELKKRRNHMLNKQQKMQQEYEHRKRQISKIKSRQEEVRRLKDLEKERKRIYDMERKMKKLERYQYLQTQKLKEELYAVNYADRLAREQVENTAKQHYAIDQERKQQRRPRSVAPFLPLGSPPTKNTDGTTSYPEGYIKWFLKKLGNVKIGEQIIFNSVQNSNNTEVSNNKNKLITHDKLEKEITRYKYYTEIPDELNIKKDVHTCEEYVNWTCYPCLDIESIQTVIPSYLSDIVADIIETTKSSISYRVDLGDYLNINDLTKLDMVINNNEERLFMLCLLCNDCHVKNGRINKREITPNEVDEAFSLSSTPLPIDPSI